MQPIEPVKVFISYAHADQELHKKLEQHLSSLSRSSMIRIWQDQEIPVGANWEDQIDTHLDEADMILLLVSANFIASNYCWNKEVQEALERHRAGTARVIPIILRNVSWQDTPLGQLQALPTGAKPVTQWKDQDEALENVVQGIRNIVAAQRGTTVTPLSLQRTVLLHKIRSFRRSRHVVWLVGTALMLTLSLFIFPKLSILGNPTLPPSPTTQQTSPSISPLQPKGGTSILIPDASATATALVVAETATAVVAPTATAVTTKAKAQIDGKNPQDLKISYSDSLMGIPMGPGGLEQSGLCQSQSDGYHVKQADKNNMHACVAQNLSGDGAISVDMCIREGHSGGLFVRFYSGLGGSYEGYLFEIDRTGHSKISLTSLWGWGARQLQDWVPSPSIRSGAGACNTLVVMKCENVFRFFVNGALLFQGPDHQASYPYGTGNVALAAVADGVSSSEVVYSNLIVYVSPC